MEPSITLYSSILLLGAAHGLFLALALLNVKGGNAVAHRLLALLILTFAVDLGVDFLRDSYYLVRFPKLNFIEDVTSFLYGPLTYLYVCALTSKNGFQFSNKYWWHFLPFLMAILLLIPFFNLSNEHVLELVYSNADVDDSIGVWILGGIIVALLPIPLIGVYITLSIRQLIRHSRVIRDEFSSIERINLRWLWNVLIALGSLFLIYACALFFSDLFGGEEQAENLLNIAVIIVIYTMGYMGLRQQVIFTRTEPRAQATTETLLPGTEESTETERRKYEKSALDSDMSRALLEELQRYMAADKPYLDNKLTLNQLAEQLGISTNYLSQVINEQTGNNFFDYINEHRVEAAKQLLAESIQTNTNILTIAMESGFNSKSAFYTAFRKHMKVTPSQFRKSLTAT